MANLLTTDKEYIMKHKHADLIHAWADGAIIQIMNADGRWEDITCTPQWNPFALYRIKPEEKKPVVRWLWASHDGRVSGHLMSDDENCTVFKTKLEWSRTEFTE